MRRCARILTILLALWMIALTGADAGSAVGRPVDDNAVLLRVDGVPYRKSDLVAYSKDVLATSKDPENDYLGDLNELIVDLTVSDDALAEMPALDNDLYVRSSVRKLSSRLLPGILFEEEFRKKVAPTVADLMASRPDPTAKYEISIIVLHDESAVPKVSAALAAGEAFADIARKYSDGISADKGGAIGAIEEGKNDLFTKEELANVLVLKDGEVSRPFKSRIGSTFVKMTKRWSAAELKRRDIEDNLAAYQAEARKKAFDAFLDNALARAEIVWQGDAVARAKDAISKGEPFPDALRTAEIVRVDGEPICVLEIEGMSRVHSGASLDTFLDRAVRDTVLVHEATRRGYRERVATVLDIGRRRAITRRFFKVKALGMPVTQDEVVAYYRTHPERFRTEEARSILVIETRDRKKAAEAARKAKKGADFRSLVPVYSESEGSKKAGGDMGFVTRKMLLPDVAAKVFSAKKGSVAGPVAVKDGSGGDLYVVVKVTGVREAGTIPLEKYNRDLLVDKIVSGKMEEFYKSFLRKASERHTVETFVNNGARGEGSDAANL